MGRPLRSRPFARPEYTWEDNIKMLGNNIKMGKENIKMWEGNIEMYHQEIERGGIDWIDAAEDRDRWRTLVIAVMKLQVP